MSCESSIGAAYKYKRGCRMMLSYEQWQRKTIIDQYNEYKMVCQDLENAQEKIENAHEHINDLEKHITDLELEVR
jgi:hypothetical protein